MKLELPEIILSTDDEGRPLAVLGETRVATLAGLLEAAPELTQPGQLEQYCEAVNHLTHGYDYRLIRDPDAYRARYTSRLESEAPDEPFQENVVRLRNFGVCDTSSITPPEVAGISVVFYVEDAYLGIPYRVTAPAPYRPEGEVTYAPLPMSPLPRTSGAPSESSETDDAGVQEEEAEAPSTQLVEAEEVALTAELSAPAAAVAPPPPPPPPSPLELLHDAIAREDQAAVQQHLLTLGVDKKVCERLLAAWQRIVAPEALLAERQAKMMDLISLIRPLTALRKVQDELWQLQKLLTGYN